jgi:DNA-directed RNA polymerase subunit RPC12/RpoP
MKRTCPRCGKPYEDYVKNPEARCTQCNAELFPKLRWEDPEDLKARLELNERSA